MVNIFGNQLDLRTITEPMDCYCVSLNGLVYDKYCYHIMAPEHTEIIHEFHGACRLILVPVGKALCNDAGEEIRIGMFLR